MSRCKAFGALACIVLLTSCGNARQASTVAIEKDQTSITFGFTPARVVTPQQPTGPQAAIGGPSSAPATPLPSATFSPIFQQSSQQVSSGPCPSAGPSDAVSSRAPSEVSGRPQPGTYRWLQTGTASKGGSKIPLPGYTAKFVLGSQSFKDSVPRSSGQPEGDNFTYATIEQNYEFNTNLVRFTWQVKTDPGVAQDPEGGLVLKAIDEAGSDGKAMAPYFHAQSSGLLFVPFPIKPGGSWTSTAVDLNRQKSFQLNGQVLTREVIDACGTLIEGWHVHATINESGAQGTLDYLVATQYGGMIAALNASGAFLGLTYGGAKTRIGQVKPDALPKGVS